MSTDNDRTQRSGPLAGLKVVDLTHVMAGPTCTLMLADMGACVIKIEKSPNGDDTRHSVPPKIGDEAASFLMMNRNKRGIVLDLKTAGGKDNPDLWQPLGDLGRAEVELGHPTEARTALERALAIGTRLHVDVALRALRR